MLSRHWREYVLGVCASLMLVSVATASAIASDQIDIDESTAVRLAREFLASDDDDKRQALRRQLERFAGDVENVLGVLRKREYPAV
jgi:hypothetical protein